MQSTTIRTRLQEIDMGNINGIGTHVDAIFMRLGFVLCIDRQWRRANIHDGLSVEADEYRITVHAETDKQDVRMQIASFPLDGVRFKQWLALTDGDGQSGIVLNPHNPETDSLSLQSDLTPDSGSPSCSIASTMKSNSPKMKTFRSMGFLSLDYDMGRIYIDLPINEARILMRKLKQQDC